MGIKRSFVLLCLLYIVTVSACLSAEEEAKASQEVGNKIVKALEMYNQDYGQYPENLEMLVPQYLSEVPKTSTGDDFFYKLRNLDGYYLGFELFSHSTKGCGYLYNYQMWECSYGESH